MNTTTKTILATLLGAVLPLAAAQGQTGLLAYDGFNGGARADLYGSTSGTGWSGPWDYFFVPALIASVGGPGLSYPGLATLPGAATTPAGSLPDLAQYTRAFPAVTGQSMFVSVLLRPENSSSAWYMLRFGDYPHQVDLGVPLGYRSYGLTVGDAFRLPSAVECVQGQTALLVLEVELVNNQTQYSLYVNPTVGMPKPTTPAVFRAAPAAPFLPGVEYRGLGGFTMDELRIGTTWESVLPAACRADVSGLGGTIGPDGQLSVDDVVVFLQAFFGDNLAIADIASLGGSVVPDAQLTADDIIVFLGAFFAGCP